MKSPESNPSFRTARIGGFLFKRAYHSDRLKMDSYSFPTRDRSFRDISGDRCDTRFFYLKNPEYNL
jgi:hypothetical protein